LRAAILAADAIGLSPELHQIIVGFTDQ